MANTLKLGAGKWATGTDTVLAFNDENNNFKPLPFSFSRASSATVVNQSGLIETVGSGEPRIDFLGNTKGALLLEPQRTNLLPYSENVLLWSTSGTVIRQDNVSISPDGTQSASTITSGNDTNFNRIRQNFSVSANSTCTASLFIKKVQTETNYLGLSIVFTGGTTDVAYVSFDSVNGISRNMDSRITAILNVVDYGTYWRLEATATDSGSNTQLEMAVYPTLSTDGINVAPGASSVRTIWGMQLELNSSYATSYIPTSGSAVTRVAENPFERDDLASKNLIGNTELTWFIDCILFVKEGGTTVAPRLINASNNQIFVGINIPPTGSSDLRIRHKDGTNASNTSSVTFISGDRYKIAVKISGTTGNAYINGTNVGTFTTAAAINYNKYSNAANNPNNIIDMRVYNTALTDAELAALTTI